LIDMNPHRAIVSLSIVALVGAPIAQQQPLRGFPADEVAVQRQREMQLRAVPSPERIREHVRTLSASPHWAGGPGSRQVAELALAQFKAAGLDAWIEEHEAYMPMPSERTVRLVAPRSYGLRLAEPVVAEDPDSGDAGQLPTFNAYSADGDVTAELVYVNYGVPEDYARLEKRGVSVKGKIVIARYGRSWRGIKPKVAWEHGAVGCLIYSDPRDDGYYQGDVYPAGPFRPEFGVQRGSVIDMTIHPGDPLTPGWGSEAGGRKLPVGDAKTILKIPVLPIAYGDALPLLQALGGQIAPEDWRGALPITYHLGPGPARVQLKLAFDWKQRPLYNVIARINGVAFPDEWVLYGNHHDAWVNGASDPTSGAAALLETARAFGELLKSGWKPRRTLVFALWDGEEWALLGSTEWAEKHKAELAEKAVAYINSDSNGKGWLSAGGSHSLQQLLNEVARDVTDPRTDRPVLDEARTRAIAGTPQPEKRSAEADPALHIAPLGSGSDYSVFLDHLTVASLNIGFGGGDTGGIYHSAYDSFTWYTKFSDGDFVYGRALAQTAGTLLLRLADAPVLPFQFTDYGASIERYIAEIERQHVRALGGRDSSAPYAIDIAPLKAAVANLRREGERYERAMSRAAGLHSSSLSGQMAELKALNKLLYTSERRLALEAGLPRREWYKHAIYAPGFYTGYAVKTLPALRESLEEGLRDEAIAAVPALTTAINNLAAQVDQATQTLTRLIGG
jgi:N-acetylated-alpha-linked acidic dipeptidase